MTRVIGEPVAVPAGVRDSDSGVRRAARVTEQHEVHALASQEAEAAFVRLGVGPWRATQPG